MPTTTNPTRLNVKDLPPPPVSGKYSGLLDVMATVFMSMVKRANRVKWSTEAQTPGYSRLLSGVVGNASH
jgi:hypothetical protein